MTLPKKTVSLAGALAICAAAVFAQELTPNDLTGLDSLLHIKVNTAAKYSQTIGEAPASVTVITGSQIVDYGVRTLDDILAHVAGFYLSYDRNYSYVGVRGFSRPTDYNDRILVLLDGHTMNDNFYGTANTGTDMPIPVDAIDRVEVVRGPGSALYGSRAMFAVINIITKSGEQLDGARLSTTAGSYRTYTASLTAGYPVFDDGEFTVSATGLTSTGQDLYFREYNSPLTNYGNAVGMDWDRNYGVLGSFMYGTWSFRGAAMSRNKGIPTGAFETLFNDNRASTIDAHQFLEAQKDLSFGSDHHLTVRTYLDLAQYKGYYPYEVMSYDMNKSLWVGGEARYCWDVRSNNRLTLGLEYRDNPQARYTLWDLNTVYFDKNFPYTEVSVYAQDEYQVTQELALTLGARFDPLPEKWQSTSPRAALVFHPVAPTILKLLYGTAFRAPNLYESAYEDPTAGYLLNPGIEPEKIRTAEFIWEQRLTQHLVWDLSVYHNEIEDLIDQATILPDSLITFRNISKVRSSGCEAVLRAETESGWEGTLSYSFQYSRNVDLETALTNSPENMLGTDLTAPISRILRGTFELHYESSRVTVVGTRTTPFLIANLGFSLKVPGDHLGASLRIRNCFDTPYSLPGGLEHRQPAIEQDGRTVTVGLSYRF